MAHDTNALRPVPAPPAAPNPGVGSPTPPAPPGYYDVPMLKPPVWRDLVAWYLFLGGLSGGAYVTARLAERFGGKRFRGFARVGTCVAAAAVLPCAPLLIADLGDPKRFHHMLRVFKPGSPMNLGAWTLTAYHGAGAAALAREWLRWGKAEGNGTGQQLVEQSGEGILLVVADFAGIPLALLLASYTGVLLTGTSTPVWCKSKWLPALFSASAVSSGASAVSLAVEALAAAGIDVGADAARDPLDRLHAAAHLAEVVLMVAYLSSAGPPLTTGRLASRGWASVIATVGAEVLKALPVQGTARRWLDIGSAALGIVGAYNLRSTIIQAGVASANDPQSRY